MTQNAPTLNAQNLTEQVCKLLGQPDLSLLEWTCLPIHGGTGEGLGIWRIRGRAKGQNAIIHWSLVLKILDSFFSGDGENDWNYWKREALLYESGLLAELSGRLIGPRCLSVTTQSATQVWIWLEDLGETTNDLWRLDDYAIAAQHLGEFNGRYLVGKPLPTQRWLSRQWLQKWLDRAPGIEQFDKLAENPAIQKLYPADMQVALEKIWHQQNKWLNVLNELPPTLCHMDAFSNNMRLYSDDGRQNYTVAFDWAYVGIGAIGEDLAPLVWANALWANVDERVKPADIERRASVVLTGYLAGLHRVGWQGDERVVRLGYMISSLLRYGLGMVPVGINIVTNPRVDEWADDVFGTSLERMIDYQAVLIREQVKLADEISMLLQ